VLRRACGYALANKGHDTRGFTAVYTALALNRFKDFWRD
jgi:hypothetical protein